MTISVATIDVRLARQIEIQSMPGSRQLWCGEFRELPGKRDLVGRQTRETRLFRCSARALEPGRLRIAPVLRLGVLTRRRSLIGYTWAESAYDLPAAAFALDVKPLPETGRPEAFSDAVGQFFFDVTVTPGDVAVGDLVTVTMSVRGQGYLDAVTAPRLSPGRHFRAYDPRALPASHGNERRFEQILVPQSTNAVAVPEVSFIFFNPESHAYQAITRGPFPLKFHEQTVEKAVVYNPEALSTNVATGAAGGSGAPPSVPPSWLARLQNSHRQRASARANARARFAPAYSAMILFDLREGEIVHVVQASGGWAKVESNARRGWVPVEQLTPAGNPR